MCGIAGLLYKNPMRTDWSIVRGFLNSLEHRGPDDLGYLAVGPTRIEKGREPRGDFAAEAILVHRRLSILDLSEAGWQPMSTPDGRYHLVFNGEIYNYLELRSELERLGHSFRSHSDSEVLLTAYSHWGLQALPRLVGMFSFAIIDTLKRRLLLVRDFFGIKPLYYTFFRDGFAFASEIKPLLELPGVSRRAHPQKLFDYQRFGLTDHGEETLFADIRRIPEAHYVEIDLDKCHTIQPKRYWQIDLGKRLDISLPEAAAQLRQLFLENVRLHMHSDVPLGAALSGGIDSSAIVMAMRSLCPNLDIHAFSYIAEDPKMSEESWIDLVGNAAGAKVHKVRLKSDNLVSDLEELIRIQEEPFGSTSIYAQQQVFRSAKAAGIKVMLDGQGADEIFGGYTYYIAARIADLLRRGQWVAASKLAHKAAQLPNMSKIDLCLRSMNVLMPMSLQTISRRWVGRDLTPPWMNITWFTQRDVEFRSVQSISGGDVLRKTLHRTLTSSSVPHLLRYEDRNSMAVSVESRVPFLTPALVSFMFSLPEEYIIAQDGTSKALFRQAMRGLVPDDVLDRKDKIGFATPERNWLLSLDPWVQRILHSEAADQIPTLNVNLIQEMLNIAQGQARLRGNALWLILNLIEWVRQFEVQFD